MSTPLDSLPLSPPHPLAYLIQGDDRHYLHPASNNPEDIAIALRDTCWTQTKSLEEFMRQQARFIHNYSGDRVRVDSVQNFVEDLFKIRFLTPVSADLHTAKLPKNH